MVSKVTMKHGECPAELVLIDSISGKWTALILYMLSQKTYRFGELHKNIPGISQKVLTQALRRLERDGVLKRTVYPVVPPQVEYAITPLGNSLVELMADLCTWARSHYEEVKAARLVYDAKQQKKSPLS